MSRSLKKGPFIDHNLLAKIKSASKDSHKPILTWSRDSVVTPEMAGFTIGVYNGKQHQNVKISEDMVGHKLGEFAKTRKFIKHGGRIAREQEIDQRTKLPPGREVEKTGKPPVEKPPIKKPLKE